MSERPWYETKTDRERELIIAKRFVQFWQWPPGLTLIKRTVLNGHEIDFDAVHPDGRTRLRLEAKYRHHRFGHYPTLFISAKKAARARELFEADELPVFFAAAFKCGKFAYADLAYPALRDISVGGRYDRNDPQDEEPMVHIPLDQLKEF